MKKISLLGVVTLAVAFSNVGAMKNEPVDLSLLKKVALEIINAEFTDSDKKELNKIWKNDKANEKVLKTLVDEIMDEKVTWKTFLDNFAYIDKAARLVMHLTFCENPDEKKIKKNKEILVRLATVIDIYLNKYVELTKSDDDDCIDKRLIGENANKVRDKAKVMRFPLYVMPEAEGLIEFVEKVYGVKIKKDTVKI